MPVVSTAKNVVNRSLRVVCIDRGDVNVDVLISIRSAECTVDGNPLREGFDTRVGAESDECHLE